MFQLLKTNRMTQLFSWTLINNSLQSFIRFLYFCRWCKLLFSLLDIHLLFLIFLLLSYPLRFVRLLLFVWRGVLLLLFFTLGLRVHNLRVLCLVLGKSSWRCPLLQIQFCVNYSALASCCIAHWLGYLCSKCF